ncbi:DUF397 domain-containing protein [Streptomyces sp. NPDC059118]|uniref:DUF397 domain-containing protein n=1 Tax=unclassified Streptomyces TaxID=2593676 RepID=UPI003695C7ED
MGHDRPFRLSRPPPSGRPGALVTVAEGPVRDSKHPEGPVLVLPASARPPFVESVKAS